MTLSSQEAANVAVVLNYGAGTQAIVAGLNSLKLPGGQRNIIEVKQFRETSRQFAGQASRTNLEFGGSAVFNDPGQQQLKTYFDANTKFGPVNHAGGECRIYLNGTSATLLSSDFMAPDTANDSESVYQVTAYDFPSVDSEGIFPFTSGLSVGGRYAFFTVHMTAATIAFVASSKTITDSGNGLVDAGFEAGQTLIVEGSTSNDGIYIISTVEAGVITLTSAATLVDEAAAAGRTLHGGK